MNDEINYSTQISSKKHAVNKTTKFFASRRLEAAVAYGCNPPVNTIFAAAKTRVRFPPMVNFFLLFLFFNARLQYMRTQVQFPAVVNFLVLIANFEYLFSHVKCFDYHRIQCPNSANPN